MSFDLSFSEEFFTDETAPYDTEPSKRPTNVYQAIVSLPEKTKREIGRKILKIPVKNLPFWLHSESVDWDILEKVRETNTCSSLTSPVRVWIDSEGDYSVLVYDTER